MRNHDTSTTSIRNKWNRKKKKTVSGVKEGTSTVLVKSRLDENGGGKRWNAIAIDAMFKIYWQVGGLPTNGRYSTPFRGPPIIPLEHISFIILFPQKVFFCWMCLVCARCRGWTGDLLVADAEIERQVNVKRFKEKQAEISNVAEYGPNHHTTKTKSILFEFGSGRQLVSSRTRR